MFTFRFLNRAMQSFDATVVVPTNFVLFTISAIISGEYNTVQNKDFWSPWRNITYCKHVSFCSLKLQAVGLLSEEKIQNAKHIHNFYKIKQNFCLMYYGPAVLFSRHLQLTIKIFLSISGIVLYKEFYGLTFLEIFMFLFGWASFNWCLLSFLQLLWFLRYHHKQNC